SNQGAKTETAEIAERSLTSLKRLSKIKIEEYLKNARNNKIFVDGIDFSQIDLSKHNLNNLSFRNCNFSEAKFPSIDGVFFDNTCNMEDCDFSNITIGKVDFGSLDPKNKLDNLILVTGQNQLQISKDLDRPILSKAIDNFETDGSKTQHQIQSEIATLDKITRLENPILNIKNANFSGTKFNNFWSINADFSGANFQNAKFRINQGYPEIGFNSFDPYLNKGLNLGDSTFEFYDNKNKKIHESKGAQIYEIDINKDLEGLLACNQIISNEFLKKMQSGQEILIEINADGNLIPGGLKLQDFNSPASYNEILDPKKIKNIEAKSVELANKYFERYNIKFVTKEMLKGRKADRILNLNIVKTSLAAGTDLCSFFNLGNKVHNVFISPEVVDKDYESVFLHEMMHMFFQHPIQNQNLLYTSKISYLPPMAKRPNSNGELVAQNIIPHISPSIIDQKLLQNYMQNFGRNPIIKEDIVTKYNPETYGIHSSFNPNKNFQNIVSFSSTDFGGEYEAVIMNGNKALAYCKTSDLYNCDLTKGLEDSQAILIMNKKTGVVKSMFLLSGENPKIKIDDKFLDLKDFLGENIFSILRKDAQGNIGFDKFQEASGSKTGFFIENKILKDREDTESQKFVSSKAKIIAKNQGEPSENLSYLIATQLGVTLSLIASVVVCHNSQRGLRARHVSSMTGGDPSKEV
ncbi:MAG: pentapeptide repeat-containing protein, partial [Alphaproteobacteria bacterium]